MKIARLVLTALTATALKAAEKILTVLLARPALMEFVSLDAQRTPIATGLHPVTVAVSVPKRAVLMPTAQMAKYVPTDSVSLGVE